MRLDRIVSGGQTGADRAALDAALAAGLPYRGWCPAGGWAEDLPEPPGLLRRYPSLRETPSADRDTRTGWNVRDSDATLVLVLSDAGSPGTELTMAVARELGRPHLRVRAAAESRIQVVSWLGAVGEAPTLNVAGPRESEQPGLYLAAYAFLRALLTQS
jgi:hypothetical protein